MNGFGTSELLYIYSWVEYKILVSDLVTFKGTRQKTSLDATRETQSSKHAMQMQVIMAFYRKAV